MSRKRERRLRDVREILMGGNGAGPENDGAEVIAQMLSNTGNTPVEAIEMDHDFVRIAEYGADPRFRAAPARSAAALIGFGASTTSSRTAS